MIGYKDYTDSSFDPWEFTSCKECHSIIEYDKSLQKPEYCEDCESKKELMEYEEDCSDEN